jgi:hypothetical protein
MRLNLFAINHQKKLKRPGFPRPNGRVFPANSGKEKRRGLSLPGHIE